MVKDQVYCFVCRHFTSINGPQFEQTFLNKGFNCWQTQAESFKYHEKTNYHKLNFEKYTMFLNLKSKQGIPFRGHDESKQSSNRGNYIELLNMFCDDNVKLKLESRYGHYTSPGYQNYCIKIIAFITRSNIIKQISAFSILVDEIKDTSKKVQLSFVIRFGDNVFNVFEKCLGCYLMVKCNASTLSQEI
ncbi:zinc finger MYM-type protein 1-like [Rhopalosiphum maidis]|uniref:zinc finger MYM-type protein 1-like n=1 Tax=Rhopalosiphum maidis TaxID=43146 RepID=UPI000F00DA71|nr:zinc finger MYM-type protein 1-like [Rhopalosiphum maidis]